MPSRKSNSSETQPEPHRSSLRRLSSIASFQTLFARRSKTANTTDTTAASSSSNLSLSLSCTANEVSAPDAGRGAASSLPPEDFVAELPSQATASRLSSKRNSYVCLPDDPIGGMPRSRTFSNLPVPIKGRQASKLSQSKSQTRLPSAFSTSTRLPSPPLSTRQHSHTRLASVESKVPVMRNRVKRSDTEPLLPTPTQKGNHFGRSTAFKENITLSPVKPLPAIDVSVESGGNDAGNISQAKERRRPWRSSIEERNTPTSSAFGYVNPYAHHPAVRIARENRSSPAYKGVPQRKPTPGGSIPQAVQRWNSQPVLTNVTNSHRNSMHGEIRQSRLMSARQAPTPVLPKTPLAWERTGTGRPKSSSVSSTNLLQQPEDARLPTHTATAASATPLKPSTLTVSCAEPSAYWAGRLCALTDRFRNEELAAQLMSGASASSSGLTPKGQTDKMHTPEASTARTKRALEYLAEMCVTSEAKESLMQFWTVYARQSGISELAPTRPPTRTIVLGSMKEDDINDSEVGGKSTSENRKASFMDRLLGRQKRRSLVLP